MDQLPDHHRKHRASEVAAVGDRVDKLEVALEELKASWLVSPQELGKILLQMIDDRTSSEILGHTPKSTTSIDGASRRHGVREQIAALRQLVNTVTVERDTARQALRLLQPDGTGKNVTHASQIEGLMTALRQCEAEVEAERRTADSARLLADLADQSLSSAEAARAEAETKMHAIWRERMWFADRFSSAEEQLLLQRLASTEFRANQVIAMAEEAREWAHYLLSLTGFAPQEATRK